MNLNALRDHIESKMALAPLAMSPTPHLVVEGFFPEETYARILSYNPFAANRGVEWMPKGASRNVSSRTPYHARKQINFHADQPFEAPADQQEFWGTLKRCFLGDNWFPELVIEKFLPISAPRFGDDARDPQFISKFRRELFLQRHDPGYYIGPHTDIPTRVFTCIFSFADRTGYEEYGTQFLTPKEPLARCWGNDHYDPADFDVHTVAPSRTFLLFFKTRHSFHAVRSIPGTYLK